MSSIGLDAPKTAMLAGGLAVIAAIVLPRASAQDFSDPADILRYKHSQEQAAQKKGLPEIDGTIRNTTTNKPGWYGVFIELGNGKQIHVIVAPSTKFYKDYKPIDANAAYPQIKAGQKIRALHNPGTDEAVRNIIITDLMFDTPPPEVDGTIRTATGGKPGTYALIVTLEKGGEIHLGIEPETKFWKDNKPVDATAAYPQIVPGQRVRILPKTTADGSSISDLMFVDK